MTAKRKPRATTDCDERLCYRYDTAAPCPRSSSMPDIAAEIEKLPFRDNARDRAIDRLQLLQRLAAAQKGTK